MIIHNITSLDTPELRPYAALTEAQLRSRLCPESALIIVESPKVINTALDAGYTPVSMLCERRHITADAADILSRCPADMPVYTGERELLASLTGYTLTRGVLCAMRQPLPLTAEQVCAGTTRICILDGVCDTTNIGAIFRSAAALGVDGVLLTPQSCHPFNRRCIRVSMGTVFRIPWAFLDGPVSSVHRYGFSTAALALTRKSVSLDHPELKRQPRLAMVFGTEGDGLNPAVIESCTYTVRIPMFRNVDSLNVAAAAAITMWELRDTHKSPVQ